MEKYKIDFVNKTFTITKAFEDKMQDLSSEEYKFYKKTIEDIPSIVVLRRTHKTPTKYVNKNKEEFKCNQFKNLKFKRMEQFMKSLPEKDKYLKEFYFLRDYAGTIQTNKYALVRKWFIAQFPQFRTTPLIYIYNAPEVINAKEFADKEVSDDSISDVA